MAQISYIKRGILLGYDILVMNLYVKASEHPQDHAENVWQKLIQKSDIKLFSFVVDDYGVSIVDTLCTNHTEFFAENCFGIICINNTMYYGEVKFKFVHDLEEVSNKLT